MTHDQLLPFLAEQPNCIVAMEACATAYDWGRQISQLGHEVKLLPPQYVKLLVIELAASLKRLMHFVQRVLHFDKMSWQNNP